MVFGSGVCLYVQYIPQHRVVIWGELKFVCTFEVCVYVSTYVCVSCVGCSTGVELLPIGELRAEVLRSGVQLSGESR